MLQNSSMAEALYRQSASQQDKFDMALLLCVPGDPGCFQEALQVIRTPADPLSIQAVRNVPDFAKYILYDDWKPVDTITRSVAAGQGTPQKPAIPTEITFTPGRLNIEHPLLLPLIGVVSNAVLSADRILKARDYQVNEFSRSIWLTHVDKARSIVWTIFPYRTSAFVGSVEATAYRDTAFQQKDLSRSFRMSFHPESGELSQFSWADSREVLFVYTNGPFSIDYARDVEGSLSLVMRWNAQGNLVSSNIYNWEKRGRVIGGSPSPDKTTYRLGPTSSVEAATESWRQLEAERLHHIKSQTLLAETGNADGREAEDEVVVIRQEQLSVYQQGEPLSKRIGVTSLDGTDIALGHLPATVLTNLEHMATRVASRFEFSAVDPKDVIRFVVRKPEQNNMIRLGLTYECQDSAADPPWLKDLQIGNNKLSCTLTNTSLLDLSMLLAESLDCEFGVTQDGEALFRNKTQPARAKHPAYIVNRKPTGPERDPMENISSSLDRK